MFKGYCALDHERIEFDGQPAEFERHMIEQHERKPIVAGADDLGRRGATAPGWRGGKIQAPAPWVAPKPSAASRRRVGQALLDGKVRMSPISWLDGGQS